MRRIAPIFFTFALALLGGCATHAPAPSHDGPEAHPPSGLREIPDAEPRVEAIRKGGPNKPYEVDGVHYEPLTGDEPLVERGLASWYGKQFHGRPTASGETYNMYAMTAAHATMPIPSYALVRNPANGREIVVRINDRGPFHKGRIIDLSYTAALKLDLLRGVAPVEVQRLTYEQIRTGSWRKLPNPESPGEPPPTYVAQQPADAPQRETLNPPTTAVAAAAATLPTPPAPTPLSAPVSLPASPTAARHSEPGYWLQLGAYRQLDGAEAVRSLLAQDRDWLAPLLAIFKEGGVNRLQAGPYASRSDAQAALDRLNGAVPSALIVERK